MKPIRLFILFAIGMMAFTVTASTTAKLEQKQKVETVNGFDIHQDYSQVVNIFQEIQIFQEVSALASESTNFKRVDKPANFYTVSKDVGWRNSQTIKHTIQKEKLPLSYLTNHIAYLTNESIVRCRDKC